MQHAHGTAAGGVGRGVLHHHSILQLLAVFDVRKGGKGEFLLVQVTAHNRREVWQSLHLGRMGRMSR